MCCTVEPCSPECAAAGSQHPARFSLCFSHRQRRRAPSLRPLAPGGMLSRRAGDGVKASSQGSRQTGEGGEEVGDSFPVVSET